MKFPTPSDSSSIPPLKRVRFKNIFPLSFQQRRIYFTSLIAFQENIWNEYFCIPFVAVNYQKLEKAIAYTIKKNDVLRTRIKLIDEEPFQVIEKEYTPSIKYKQIEGEITDLGPYLQQNANCTFDLFTGPLYNFYFIENDRDEGILQIVRHHIISDASSDRIIGNDIAGYYFSGVNGLKAFQYTDYIVWQQKFADHVLYKKQEEYWLNEFKDSPSVLKLATDFHRPEIQTFDGEKFYSITDEGFSKKLSLLAIKSKGNNFSVLLLTYFILLHRLSEQEEIVIGTPFHGRNLFNGLKDIAGIFVNTIPLKLRLEDKTVVELLSILMTKINGAYENQSYPFDKLVQKVNPPRENSYSPLFQVWFNLLPDTYDEDDYEISRIIKGFEAAKTNVTFGGEHFSRYDLSLYCRQTRNRIIFEWVYNKNIFHKDRIEEVIKQYHLLLNQIIEDPNTSIYNYSILSQPFQDLLPDPTIPIVERSIDNVVSLLSDISKTYKDSVAIVENGVSWSYQQLDSISTHIAKLLVSKGVGKNDVVGITGKSSFGLISAIIGILKSGAAFLNFSNNQPTARNIVILKEAKPKLIINIEEDLTSFFEDEDITSIGLDGATGELKDANINIENIQLPVVEGNDSAYIFFTSGTTGKPKGIVGNHKGLAHFMDWEKNKFQITSKDRVSQLINLTFDPFLRDVFLPLTTGATLCIPPEDLRTDADNVVSWLKKEEITLCHMVPSLAELWINNTKVEKIESLRYLCFAGEQLKSTIVKKWRKKLNNEAVIVNFYGPTETTLCKCFYIVPKSSNASSYPVGKPLPDTQVYILNRKNKICGLNEVGEIVIRTPYRAAYLNPSSNQNFKTNPFTHDQTDLFYYTGDMGRYNKSGEIEILGRKDQQIKLNGVRVELREIESIIDEIPNVKKSIIVYEEKNEIKRLTAFLVLDQEISTLELRQYLKLKLPTFMIPSSFLFIDEIPVTHNGKVNINYLKSIQAEQNADTTQYFAPETLIEKTIAAIWKEATGVSRVGLYDNFFDIGGHSFLVIKVIAEIKKKVGVTLSFKDFTKQTLRQVAAKCAK